MKPENDQITGMAEVIKLALFGDGCAAAVFKNGEGSTSNGSQWVVENYSSRIVDGTKDALAFFWNNDGQFDHLISPKLPLIVKHGVYKFVNQILKEQSLCLDDIDAWAVHP